MYTDNNYLQRFFIGNKLSRTEFQLTVECRGQSAPFAPLPLPRKIPDSTLSVIKYTDNRTVIAGCTCTYNFWTQFVKIYLCL